MYQCGFGCRSTNHPYRRGRRVPSCEYDKLIRLGRVSVHNTYRCAGALLFGASALRAQPTPPPPGTSPIEWQLHATSAGTQQRLVTLVGRIPDGWYLYSLTQPAGGPTRTELSVLPPWRLAGDVRAPDPTPYPDRNFNIMSEVYTDSVRFGLPITSRVASKGRRAHSVALQVAAHYQTCTNRFCLPARTDTVIAEASVAAAATLDSEGRLRPTAERPREQMPLTLEASDTATRVLPPPNTPQTAGANGFGALLATAVGTALLALLTPCVFPMIPITVGFFSGRPAQAARTLRRELFTFAGGIIAAFVALGVGVSLLLGATGAFELAANPWMNLVVAALFAAFALQLAGVMQLRAPHTLVSRLSAVTQAGQGTPMLLLMGATFALTSFTCTAPFVGSLLVLAASGGVAAPVLGILAFAATFAAPFVLLALAPRLVARLPRSGSWLATVKRVAAFAELAVVVKFVSNAGMVWGWPWMTRDLVICAWLLLLAALLIMLLRSAWPAPRTATFTKLTTDTRGSWAGATVVALAMLWLGRGLAGHSLGELESYLPPRTEVVRDAAGHARELPWTLNDWPTVVARATSTNRPILIDFTGYTCTNCRWMEANMFTRPAVQAVLARFERARLYTDGTGEPYRAQQALQAERFGSVALPLYVVVHPDGRVVQQFLGMTRDEREFLAFLASGVTAP